MIHACQLYSGRPLLSFFFGRLYHKSVWMVNELGLQLSSGTTSAEMDEHDEVCVCLFPCLFLERLYVFVRECVCVRVCMCVCVWGGVRVCVSPSLCFLSLLLSFSLCFLSLCFLSLFLHLCLSFSLCFTPSKLFFPHPLFCFLSRPSPSLSLSPLSADLPFLRLRRTAGLHAMVQCPGFALMNVLPAEGRR